MKKLILTVAVFGFLAACETGTIASQPTTSEIGGDAALSAALSGRTLTLGGLTINVGTDGTLSGAEENGEPIVGTWAVKGGEWCRTLTSPASFAGSACQSLVVEGNTATINGNVYTIG